VFDAASAADDDDDNNSQSECSYKSSWKDAIRCVWMRMDIRWYIYNDIRLAVLDESVASVCSVPVRRYRFSCCCYCCVLMWCTITA